MIVESRLECVGCKADVGLYMVVFTIDISQLPGNCVAFYSYMTLHLVYYSRFAWLKSLYFVRQLFVNYLSYIHSSS